MKVGDKVIHEGKKRVISFIGGSGLARIMKDIEKGKKSWLVRQEDLQLLESAE